MRATYIERGRLSMLSHLEVARTIERTIRRAGLPYAVSQGFSPHMKVAFGAALPVGVGSVCEIFDVQLTDYVAPEKALEALRASCPPDLMVQSCAYIRPGEKAASVAFPISTYEAVLSRPVACIEVPESISVVRKRKEKVLVVADFLVSGFFPVGEGGPGSACPQKSDRWEFSLEAKPSGSLRPDALLRACLDRMNEGASPDEDPLRIVSVTRIGQRSA
ncbi:MAG: TIGR03936 family radical SAM-associated protein [Berryella intestinalis]|uniref:TIGR03936 family radical SAM-associated protein n=1 Tax=Berryella intestinalis TaxID=1531429 RepID=UPI002A5330F8|nr:TIGR03936 family radical SAM-associated protein [Berryella intestinalis]MDD7369122.1 TIGR03936 family radical SAM-associated protein [Berryella intestinalis]